MEIFSNDTVLYDKIELKERSNSHDIFIIAYLIFDSFTIPFLNNELIENEILPCNILQW